MRDSASPSPATISFLTGILSQGPLDPAGVDWQATEQVLRYHRMGGLAYARDLAERRAGGSGFLPEVLRRGLEPVYLDTALRTTVAMESAARCREVLGRVGIESVLFKGAALVDSGVYADPGERSVDDYDLLVRPGKAADAVRVLEAAGFSPWTPWTPKRQIWVSSFCLDDGDGEEALSPTVDLHWSSVYRALRFDLDAAKDPDPLWSNWGPEAQFVLCAQHLLKHLRVVPHLRGLGDLCRLAPQLTSAETLALQAERRGFTSGLPLVLSVLHHWFGVSLDAGIQQVFGADSPPSDAVASHLSPEGLFTTGPRPIPRLAGLGLRWRLEGGPGPAFRELFQVAFPSGRWLEARYESLGAGAAGRRIRYIADLSRWTLGRAPSPLSPNQDLEV